MIAPTDKPSGAHKPLLDSAETLTGMVSNIKEGIYIAEPNGRLLDGNPALLELFGVASRADLPRHNLRDFCIIDTQWDEEEAILQREGEVRDFELEIRRPDGSLRTVRDACHLAREPATGLEVRCGILVDITKHKALERELQALLVRDPLTGCYNRRYLDHLRARLETDDGPVGAIVADVDNFKRYNDEYGHDAGDQILVKLARFFIRQVRAEDAVVRLGGDEFLVILLGDSVQATQEIAARFSESAATSAPVPISLGWSVREAGEPIEHAVARADQALIHVRVHRRGFKRRKRATGPFLPI